MGGGFGWRVGGGRWRDVGGGWRVVVDVGSGVKKKYANRRQFRTKICLKILIKGLTIKNTRDFLV